MSAALALGRSAGVLHLNGTWSPPDNAVVTTHPGGPSAVYQTRSRVRATVAMAAFALLILVTSASQHALAAGLIFATVAAAVGRRNWIGGVTVTQHELIIRNVTRTVRVPLTQVADVSFAPSGALSGRWGYLHVQTRRGVNVRVTSLRRSPLDGAALAVAIKDDVAARAAGA
jgi:hypothetical protein